MKRTLLSMTTAIALALPAASHADVEDTVADLLVENGYPASSIEMLSEGQIAELYLTATSENPSDVRGTLDGIEFSEDMSDAPLDAPTSDVEMTVADVLVENGYSADMVSALSGTDIAAIYTAYTSEDQAGTSDAIASAIETNASLVSDDPSAAEMRAMTYLSREGYSMQQIDSFDQSELIAVYVALSSGDQQEINTAVTSALDS